MKTLNILKPIKPKRGRPERAKAPTTIVSIRLTSAEIAKIRAGRTGSIGSLIRQRLALT